MMRISAGAALRAWAVDRKLSSSPVPCFSLFLDPSVCTEDFRFGAMAILGQEIESVQVCLLGDWPPPSCYTNPHVQNCTLYLPRLEPVQSSHPRARKKLGKKLAPFPLQLCRLVCSEVVGKVKETHPSHFWAPPFLEYFLLLARLLG